LRKGERGNQKFTISETWPFGGIKVLHILLKRLIDRKGGEEKEGSETRGKKS